MDKVYYDPKHSSGFGLVVNLVKASRNTKRDVEEWLAGQETYTLHKLERMRFPRNTYSVTNIDDASEMDLADLSAISRYNDKYK
jgi:hypothetical protein